MKIAIAIPSSTNTEGLARLLRALGPARDIVEPYVVLNGAPGHSLDVVTIAAVKHEVHPEPIGYTEAQLRAVLLAQGRGHDVIVMLNDDACPVGDPAAAIEELVRPILSKEVQLAGPQQLWCCATGLPFLTGWCLAVAAACVDLPLLDARLPGGFGTDIDLCQRFTWKRVASDRWGHDGSRTVHRDRDAWELKVLEARRRLLSKYGTPETRLKASARIIDMLSMDVPADWTPVRPWLDFALRNDAGNGWLAGTDGQRTRCVTLPGAQKYDGFVGLDYGIGADPDTRARFSAVFSEVLW